MKYSTAAGLRRTSLTDLITNRLVYGDSGIASSIGSSISDKFKASLTGLKESVHPLNIARKMMFGSRLGTALAGRMMGVSKENTEYFANKGKKGKNIFFTSLTAGRIDPVRTGEPASDILAKMYNFMNKVEDHKKIQIDILRLREEEDSAEVQKKHEEIISAFKRLNAPKKQAETMMKKSSEDINKSQRQEKAETPPVLKPAESKIKSTEAVVTKPKETPVTPTTVPTPKPTPAPPTPKPTPAPAPPTPKPTPAPAPPTVTPITPKPTVSEVPLPAPKPVVTAAKAVVAAVAVGSATKLIAKEEGLKINKQKNVVAYWDPPGHEDKLVSIGYGHQIKGHEYKQGFIQIGNDKVYLKGERGIDTVMTKEQAVELLKIDLPIYEKVARDPLGSSWEKLTENQKNALILYVYNTGRGGMLKIIKEGFKKAIDDGNMELATYILAEKSTRTVKGIWNEALDKRRRREAAIFAQGINNQEKGKELSALSTENVTMKKEQKTPSIVSTTFFNSNETVVQQPAPIVSQKEKEIHPMYRR